MAISSRVNAGDHRHRIQIAKPNLAIDGSGGWKISEQDLVATVWASIEDVTGKIVVAAQEKVSQVTLLVRMRYFPGVIATMYVRFGDNRMFEIQAVLDPDFRKKVLQLICIERNSSTGEIVS